MHEKGDQNQGQQDTISKIALKHRKKDRAAFQISSDKMDEGAGVFLVFLLPSGSDQLSVSRGLHEAWERCSEQGCNLRWADEENILKLRAPLPEQVETYQDMLE